MCGPVASFLEELPDRRRDPWRAPCQPFSDAGENEGKSDERDCLPDLCEAVERKRPRGRVGLFPRPGNNCARGRLYLCRWRLPPIGPVDHSCVREADLALARRAARGDREALHAVVDRHARELFRAARGLCPTAADAEDAVQETLVAAFRWIGTYDGRASLLTWMSRILFREAKRISGRNRRGAAVSLDEATDSPGARPATNGDDCRLDLAAQLPRLAPEFREVIVLRELQGMSYADIAATLRIPKGTVESRLHRARKELRELLRAYRP